MHALELMLVAIWARLPDGRVAHPPVRPACR
jgi:hypothetical protein